MAGGIAAAGTIMGALSPEAHAQAGGTVTEHVLAPLPYAYDALEP